MTHAGTGDTENEETLGSELGCSTAAVRALEFYSGIGGLHRALSQSAVHGFVLRAFDWDQCACRVYESNFGKDIVQQTDISSLSASELGRWNADIWLLSPSCQPYTVLNPLAKGAADPRAKSFIHLMEDVLPDLVNMNMHPHYLLVENVAGFENSGTRLRLLATLDMLGYTIAEFLLTPLQFGIPNSRLRYYLTAKAKPLSFMGIENVPGKIWRHIPGRGHDWIDPRQNPRHAFDKYDISEIREYLDEDAAVDGVHPHRVPDHVLEKWGRLFDIVVPSAQRSCCFTRGYVRLAERTGSVLQMNECLDTAAIFDRFLAAWSRGEKDAVQILHPLRIRYFTPTELLRMFGLITVRRNSEHSDFRWPRDVSQKTQYRLIGNSVNVRVVSELVTYLFQEPTKNISSGLEDPANDGLSQ